MPIKNSLLQRFMELSQVRRTIARLKDEGSYARAQAVLADAFVRHTGSDSRLLHALPTEQLIALLRTAELFDADRGLLIALLLYSEAELLAAQGEDDTAGAHKALQLMLEAFATDPELAAAYQEELERLVRYLDEASLSAPLLRRLVSHYLRVGRWAKADDLLYLLTTLPHRSPETLRLAEQVYRELLNLDDDLLAAGGLPREEVAESLAQLRLP
ncbi:MAG: hypothetical protein KGZ35_06115 [Truepera sp.]|nr:hypothetical protein [Truepera sp.]